MTREEIHDAPQYRSGGWRRQYDDSIVGFNEAWDVVSKLFREILP